MAAIEATHRRKITFNFEIAIEKSEQKFRVHFDVTGNFNLFFSAVIKPQLQCITLSFRYPIRCFCNHHLAIAFRVTERKRSSLHTHHNRNHTIAGNYDGSVLRRVHKRPCARKKKTAK